MALKQKIIYKLALITRKVLNTHRPSLFSRFTPYNILNEQEENTVHLTFCSKTIPQFTLHVSSLPKGIIKLQFTRKNIPAELKTFFTNYFSTQEPPPQDILRLTQSNGDIRMYHTPKNSSSLTVHLSSGTIQITSSEQKTVSLNFSTTKKWIKITVAFKTPQYVFGLGENTVPMNKQGKTLIMWNLDNPSYELGSTPLYQSIPVSIYHDHNGKTLGLIMDYPGYSKFTFSKDGRNTEYLAKTNSMVTVYVLTGPILTDVMKQLYYLAGKPLLIPKWAFGYQQSRWSYSPKETVLRLAKAFREKQIPCDVLYLDIDYMNKYKCFTWGKHFEPHTEFLKELHDMGFKIVTILDPGIKIDPTYHVYRDGLKHNVFMRYNDDSLYKTSVWAGPSHFPDFLNQKVQDWWARLVASFVKDGIDGVWCDMNEPSTFDARSTFPSSLIHNITQEDKHLTVSHGLLHNLYGLFMAKATLQGLQSSRDPSFVITRSSYFRGQQYSITWTGDNKSSWDHFENTISMLLNLSMSGQPINGPDIGGFRGDATPELFKRWIQESVFYPFMRNHTAYGTRDQEPWAFTEDVENASKQAITLRYMLIPYLYSEYIHAYKSNQPVLRPLFYETSNSYTLDPVYYETQVFYGRNLLFTPYHSIESQRVIYLPPGTWTSWWTKQDYQGNKEYKITEQDMPIPLFIKENSIVPIYSTPPQYIPNNELPQISFLILIQSGKTITYEYHEHYSETKKNTYLISVKHKLNELIFIISRSPSTNEPIQTNTLKELTLFINVAITKTTPSNAQYFVTHSLMKDTKSWTKIQVTASNVFSFPFKITCIIE